jgi:LuxR family transcriptional regulator, maltose regulon positive regulatory protein
VPAPLEAAVQPAHPPLFRHHARRPRLTRLLDECRAQAILITAPAGYGKTTLALEWLQGREQVVWYRATSASADVAAFSAGLSDVLAALVPGTGERLKQRLRVADTPERAARPLAELLAEDLASWPEAGLLVIDDYQLVADSAPVEDFFDWLLTLASQLRVLVTSRRRPRWASARRILYGEIAEIGREQLAMTAEEAGRVLEDRSSGSVRALVTRAEGWPAIIGLAALTASEEIPSERVSDALYRYFAEEVVRREAPEVERFMLLASLPSALDGRISREVLGITDSEAILDRLVADGLLQPAGDYLRFHPLLRSFLLRRLKAEEPQLFHRLVERVVCQAQRDDRWEDAFEIAALSGRARLAMDVLEKGGPGLLAAGRIETLERWLDECGSSAGTRPAIQLMQAEIALRKGAFSEASARAEAVATRLAHDDVHSSKAWHLAGQALYLGSQSERARDFQRQAKALAQSEEDMKRALWGLAMTEAELGVDGVETHIDALEKLARSDVNTRLRVGLGRQMVAANRGSFKGIWDIISPLTVLADHADDPMAQTTLWANASYLCIARADYDRAVELAQRAFEACEQYRLDFARGYCIGYLAAAEIGQRRFRSAAARLRELSTLADAQDNSYVRVMHAVTSIRLALSRGQPSHAIGLSVRFDDAGVPAASRGERLSLLAVAHAAERKDDVAHALCEEALAITSAVETTVHTAAAKLIISVIKESDRNLSDHAHAVLQAAHDADYLDAFVLSYRAYPPILALFDSESPPLLLQELVRRARDVPLARRLKLDVGVQAGDATGLTQRELEVFALLGEGLTNAQIARKLYITESTVKVHVHHILEKLGARTRLQAALAAQDTITDSN